MPLGCSSGVVGVVWSDGGAMPLGCSSGVVGVVWSDRDWSDGGAMPLRLFIWCCRCSLV